jgi:signal transduction histidine kinase/DNA-binding response OmpR family regulator
MTLRLFILINVVTISAVWSQEKNNVDHISELKNRLRAESPDTSRISLYHQLASADPANALEYETIALEMSLKLKDPSAVAQSYARLGSVYRNQSNYYKAIELYNKAIASAAGLQDPFLVQTYLELGIAYLRMAEYDSAEKSLLRGLEINKTKRDIFLEASIYNAMGNVSKDRNDYKQAIENYLLAVKLFKELNDKSGLTQAVSNIGNVEYLLGNYDKALQYAQESLAFAEESQRKSSIAYSNRLIGRIYRKQKKFDEALASYSKAVEIYQSLGAKRDVSETYYNAGNIFFEKNDLNKAIEYYHNALAIQRTIPDTLNMAYSYSAIGQGYYQLRKYNQTLVYLDSAARLAERKKLPYIMLDVHDYRSLIYAARQQYDRAYENHLNYSTLKDSLTSQENRLAAQELENKYQDQNKEEQIKALNASNEVAALQLQQRNTQRNYLVGLSVLALALLGVLYNRYKIKLKTTRKLEELHELKSRFFTNVSHEFRTPLTLIIGPLQKRLAKTTDPEEKADLELMTRSAQQLSSLINQLLDLSKLEFGNMRLQVSEGDARQMLRLVIASFESFADHKEIRLISDIDVGSGPAFFDHEKIEQVISNLLSNAFKFTPPGGEVKLSARISDQQLFVSVKDTGIGIAPEKLSQVFNRFYQVDDSATRLAQGSGIGLALCKELVELHKGKITVESDAGLGSKFIFTIPIGRDRYKGGDLATTSQKTKVIVDKLDVTSAQDLDLSIRAEDNAAPLILVAEDNRDMREFIRGVLHPTFRVITVANGKDAIEQSMERIPDLIITDVMMPIMDGHELCHRLKSTPATSHIPVIMLTAKADLESKLDGLEIGADDYVTKPFDSRELQVRVQNLVEQRKHLQEIFRTKVTLQPQDLNLSKPNEKFLRELMQVVEENYSSQQFGVDQLAEHLFLSRMQLHRKLKAMTDESPGDFIRRFRLKRAQQLLQTGGLQVGEVAYRTGFNNLSHFTKSFKEFTGTTPTEFLSLSQQSRSLQQKHS